MTNCNLPPIKTQQVKNLAEIPWGVNKINAPKIWDEAQGENVVVAILDTGCDINHSDLKDSIVGGRNFTTDFEGDVENFHDNQGHGTHCAGVVAGVINENGIIGVAPQAKLLIGKVLTGQGTGDFEGVTKAIKWAMNWRGENGERVRVISMSLGGPDKVPQLHSAIKEAIAQGIAVVVAAGNLGDNNENTDEYAYPGAYEEVIEVGATDINDKVASFSNTNDKIDFVAPGVDIVSTMPGEQWAKMSGTSMATPHVAGMIAVLISKYEKDGKVLTEPEIFELLLQNVRPLKASKKAVGHGIIDFDAKNIVKEPEKDEFKCSIVEKDGKYYIEAGPFYTNEAAEKHLIKL